jgi:hypothetical protein
VFFTIKKLHIWVCVFLISEHLWVPTRTFWWHRRWEV